MSTFLGFAWLDVADRAGVDAVLAALDDPEARPAPPTVDVRLHEIETGWRVEAYSDSDGYLRLPDLVVHVMRRTGLVARAFIALNHDEYGAEHLVLAMRSGGVERMHHRFIHPRTWWGLPVRQGTPWETDLPTIEPVRGQFTGRLVDGPAARSAIADLYGVDPQQIGEAGRRARRSHHELCFVIDPFLPWLDGLGIERSDRSIEVGRVRDRAV